MGLASFFSFGSDSATDELPNIYPFGIDEKNFVDIDVVSLYSKILTDVVERTHGISEDDQAALWDNCLASESNEGLVTLLSKAMAEKGELFLVYDKATGILRKATGSEQSKIREDYKTKAESATGTYISFKCYRRTDMIRIYSALEYCTIAGLNKNARLSSAIQIKIDQLRSSVGLNDSAIAKAQAQLMATSLKGGRDILMDAKDIVETGKPDLTATQVALQMLNEKRAFYLGLPSSYITGESAGGMSDTGKGDSKKVEQGLKNYWVSIMKPALKSIFGAETTFETDDFDMLSTTLEALKTFSVTDDTLLSHDNKLRAINKLMGLPEDTKGDEPPEQDPNAPELDSNGKPVDPNADPKAPPKPGDKKPSFFKR